MLAVIASIVLAFAAVPAPAPSATPVLATSSASARPAAKPLPAVIVNGVLFRAVEFDTGRTIWRNLAITVTADRVGDWRALPVAVKNGYAQQMIDAYRAGTKYGGDIKLTFIDERNATLDQYLWTPPVTSTK